MEKSGWLLDLLRYSLKTSAYPIAADEKPPQSVPDLPGLKKLEGSSNGGRDELSNRVGGGDKCYDRVVKDIAIHHAVDENGECSSSSGSSTIEGTASPPRKSSDEDEETPLLVGNPAMRRRQPRWAIFSCLQAFLIYQPRPIPFFNKALPSNAISLVVLAFFALNVFYMFFHINFNMFEAFVLADRFGLLFVANLPYLYILAAKNQPLHFLMGQSYESLNLIHRRLGELLCLEAVLHFGGMCLTWYQIFRPIGFGFLHFLTLKVTFLGLIALISYELLYFTSLASFRQRWYELFLGTHVALQAIALLFVFFHHSASRPYVGISLAIFLIDRVLYRLSLNSMTVSAQASIFEDDETVKLCALIPIQRTRHSVFGRKRSIAAGWKATDHVFVTIPSLGPKYTFQAHPFTIASPAPVNDDQEKSLELLIRARDGFSADLLMRTRSHKLLSVRFDGPYGSSHARTLLADSSLALIIAGGSGIAVAWPLIYHLLSNDIEMGPGRRIVLLWVIHEAEHISWIGRKALKEVEERGIELVLPRATIDVGRPDLKRIIKEKMNREKGRIGVVVSGPDGMNRTVRNACAGLVRDGRDVGVAVEKFGW